MIWLEIIGWLGSALLVWSLLQVRILRLRAINLAGCFVLIGYNGVLHVWPMVEDKRFLKQFARVVR